MAVLLEGAALPKPDVCTKYPEASEKALQLRAVAISIFYKIMPRTGQFPTGQGNSFRGFCYLSPLLLVLLIQDKLTLLSQSKGDRLTILLGFIPSQPVLPQMVQKLNKSPPANSSNMNIDWVSLWHAEPQIPTVDL